MRKINTTVLAAIAFLLFPLIAIAEDQVSTDVTHNIQPLPQDLEIQLALSSLPPHLRDQATVYILNPDQGYEIARKGSNGFHAFVDRTDIGAFRGTWPYTEYGDDILVPISFDSAGAKAIMPVFFDVAEMRGKGTPPGELKQIINNRYKSGHYRAPERPGISYMLSPVLRVYGDPDRSDDVVTFNIPHYMFYAPGISNQDIGGKFASPYPFVLNRTPSPHGYIIQLVGLTEKAEINKEYEGMIERLCETNEAYCLPTKSNQ